MIGVFGIYKSDRSEPADSSTLAARIRPAYKVFTAPSTGASLGVSAHLSPFQKAHYVSDDGQVTAVVSGSVHNLAEIRVNGRCAAGPAELLALLATSDALDRLVEINGQFAGAIYLRACHRLILVTDRLATFPLHLWRGDYETVFASHIYTLLGHSRIRRLANVDVIAQLFTMQRTIGRHCPIAGVDALPAGSITEIDSRGRRERIYWRLTWRRADFSLDEGARLLADTLRKAVVRQTGSGRCGLLLSGGVDSRLVLAAGHTTALSCWTTASYGANPELALARRVATALGAEHHSLIVDPADTLRVLDDTTQDSDGLYPASTPMSIFLPEVAKECETIFTGHGLDYTLRGYYLPARFLEIAGSRTRLPTLRSVPARPTGADILQNLRQGPPRTTIERIISPGRAPWWWQTLANTIQESLAPWLDSDEPYNAWDAFILHAVSKHYAFTSMVSVRAVADLAMPAFDNDVFDLYLRMPPLWRCRGRMVMKALRLLSPEAAAIPNANTHFRADLGPWLEIACLLGRATLRRLGLASRPKPPSTIHSAGSWQNLDSLYREEPAHRRLLLDIRSRLDALTFGTLSADGLATCIDEHLEGRRGHAKLLRQLLTHDAWVRRFGIEGHA